MGYILYSLTVLCLVSVTSLSSLLLLYCLLLTSKVLYLTRSRWVHLVPIPDYVYHRLPSSFSNDVESGFTSDDFNLTANVAAGDSRQGLDQYGKREVQKIMRKKKVGFDEARRLYTEQRFAKNNIGADGRPRDPKFVSFS